MNGETVRIHEDMSPDGMLILHRQEDGDVIVCVVPSSEGNIPYTAEFCTAGGGGRSPNTHRALVALIEAVKKDLETHYHKNVNGVTP